MRLTCPRCGAEYEIAENLIPQQGREVECWACNHVWRQAALTQSAEFNPDARPQLNRPLNESILSVLREEAARELEARKGGHRPATAAPDHNSATGAFSPAAEPAATEPAPVTPVPPAPLPLEAGTVATDPSAQLGDVGREWPAATITAPPPVAPIVAAAEPAAEPAAEAPPAPDARRHDEIAAGQGAHDHQAARHGSIAHFDIDDFDFPPPPRRAAKADGAEGEEAEHDPSPATLPDAEALAATLTGPEMPPPEEHASEEHPSSTLTGSPQGINLPATALPTSVVAENVVATPRPGGFASGFGLAVMLGCAALALYALAPRLSPEDGLLMSWRHEVDRGRLWLDDSVTSIFAPKDSAPDQTPE